jgi:hypothetical protein
MAEIAAVLLHHEPQVIAHLDMINAFVSADGPLAEALKVKGESILKSLESAAAKGASKSGSLTLKVVDCFRNMSQDVQAKIQGCLAVLDYVGNWLHIAKKHFETLSHKATEFDLQWNQVLTLNFCRIFVTMSRIFCYFAAFPNCCAIVLIAEHIESLRNLKFTRTLKHLRNEIGRATNSPFESVRRLAKPIDGKLFQLVSQIGLYLVRVFGSWPIVKWGDYAIFQTSDTVPAVTLPPITDIVFCNLILLRELCFFFSLTFQSQIAAHPQLSTLAANVFSDCNNMFISRTASFPLAQFLE